MDRIKISGGRPLEGTIQISGAKNAALPLMIASLLTSDRLTLKNVPNLADVNLLARILRNHGADHSIEGKRASPTSHLGETFHLTARDIVDTTAPYEMVSRMRASALSSSNKKNRVGNGLKIMRSRYRRATPGRRIQGSSS